MGTFSFPVLKSLPPLDHERFAGGAGQLDVLGAEGAGCIAFSPLAQGLLSTKYLGGIPDDSRANEDGFLKRRSITEERLDQVRALDVIARQRGQSLAQMALAWVLRRPEMALAIIGASRPEQIADNVRAVGVTLPAEAMERIDRAVGGVVVWS